MIDLILDDEGIIEEAKEFFGLREEDVPEIPDYMARVPYPTEEK